MKIILLEKIGKLGEIGEIIKVKEGYARNFLIPYKKALFATSTALKEFEIRKTELKNIQNRKLLTAGLIAKKLNNYKLKIKKKSSLDGKLFGSVTSSDIANNLRKFGFRYITSSYIMLNKTSIKNIGEYSIKITLADNIKTKINLVVERDI